MTVLISVLVIILTATGQIFLKLGADSKQGNPFINGFVISGYASFLLTIVLSYYLMKIIPLKYFTVIMSSNYVVVMIGSKYFLNETITKDRIFGTMLITIGIVVFLLK